MPVPDHGAVRAPGRADTTWLRAALLVLLLAAGAVVALTVDLPDVDAVRGRLDGAGAVGWAALVGAVALVLTAPVPRTAVSVLLGVVAGFLPGLLVALGGAMVAAVLGFGLARWLGRSAVTRLAGPRLDRLDRLLVDRGFVALLVGRLIPVVPFVVLSYGSGLTAMRLLPYAAATALGILPSTVVQVGVGASAPALVSGATAAVALPLAALVLAGVVWFRRRRAGLSPS
ncbi:VTT domain-containing protein [Blastococcus sp. TML/M2B]|uniref:TVP38/TMEM64 family protein n=1 Tax=Blastococcus sp. TML/M2B TaxID=2798727 RepID=UPI00190E3127|nr:VTT domain-containing protein [Blastococcus sp. TML/M2B]MBN1092230.1 VTT domain-containing protein [Blastococcus sp. TML/M2B]